MMTFGILNFVNNLVLTQQTFVLMKTSWRRLDQDEYVRLSLTSSEDVFKTSSRRLGQDQYIRLGHTSSRRLQNVFKTSSRRLQIVFKTSSRRLQDVVKTFWRHLQDVFKTSSTRLAKISSRGFQGVPSSLFVLVNTSTRSIQHLSLCRGICLGNTTSEKFMVNVQNLQER